MALNSVLSFTLFRHWRKMKWKLIYITCTKYSELLSKYLADSAPETQIHDMAHAVNLHVVR